MAGIQTLASQYQLLELTASYLSALDILNLALTCTRLHTDIRKSNAIFDRLKRVAVCDGHGLKARQEYRGLYAIKQESIWSRHGPLYDEEIEVRVWNRQCDAVHALPCLRCRVNVCEECRYMPRVRDGPDGRSRRRPHLEDSYSSHDIRCYCGSCDNDVERNLPLSLSEYCDCDQYTRWICMKCKVEEDKENGQYYRTRTKNEYIWPTKGDDGIRDDGMWLQDHQEDRAFWCPCGVRAPRNGNIRCGWCLRRHNATPETFMRGERTSIPFFDNDPCHPKSAWNPSGERIMYPTLAYNGPIAP